ncbi:hypothetical protein ARMSODRAFT_1089125 [Armillaria solidipes]|uniref:Family A G protein-coupled receptor-like protein n=1 Tax=Armillaria solidipes TaxID=1076256 RepID=A0A2H3B938_9AGAR|nr:hypothetical protein ARMSODRAFT_1089125 [Armillaria solidipes]
MQALPLDLSPDDKSDIMYWLDLTLNRMILQALLHGLYTGIVTVTLWVIFSSPKRLRSTFLCTIIIALYFISSIAFGSSWAFGRRGFIEYGDNCLTVYTALLNNGPSLRAYYLISDIAGGISTLLVDMTIIWRCWVLWERQWRVIFIPIICAIGSIVMKAMQMRSTFHSLPDNINEVGQFAAEIDWSLLYILLMLATTLMCTSLIIYRIFRHARRTNTSLKVIEMLIESSAMYSLSLILYLALVSKNLESSYYADTIVTYVKPIATILLVGRVSAHANASLRRQHMVAMWENHPPLVGCFREEGNANSHQTVSGLSGEETV